MWQSQGIRHRRRPSRRAAAVLLLAVALIVWRATDARATTAGHGPSPEVAAEATAEKIEIARLRVVNVANGVIEGSRDGGRSWQLIGHVLRPTQQANPRGYNASKYAAVGTVAATAVNAIHLKAGENTTENRGIIWSLAPAAESEAGTVSLQSEISPGSAVYTDIAGGSGIFGGPFTPFVGNPVLLDKARDNRPQPLPEHYVPALGDVWVIPIERPRHYPRQIVFENRFGGLITLQYRSEEPRVIGQVLRPVQGIGRFVGSYFAAVGRLRANHNGVIDISTSPRGKIGSFQIVPANHAMSPETHYIRELTQWMVVGPVSALDPSWEGTAPLYSAYLRPRYDRADLWNEDPIEGLAGRFAFEVRKRGSDQWQRMPELWLEPGAPLPAWAATALSDVTHIRIIFPFTWDDPVPKANPAAPPPGETPPLKEETHEQAAQPAAP